MSQAQKQELINDMMFQLELREHDFPVIDEYGRVRFPIATDSGVVRCYREEVIDTQEALVEMGYKGLALEINDHGNVIVWNCFKNGNRREIASRV